MEPIPLPPGARAWRPRLRRRRTHTEIAAQSRNLHGGSGAGPEPQPQQINKYEGEKIDLRDDTPMEPDHFIVGIDWGQAAKELP